MTPVMEYSYYSWQVYPDGITSFVNGNSVDNSYGFRRTRAASTSLGLSTHPVTSTTTPVPRIPTVFDIIRPKLPIKYWWLRSPQTDRSDYGWQVFPSGVVSYDSYDGRIFFSYGRISPSTELYNTQYTYTVSRVGDVDVNSGVYNDSYGI